ncbi:MAG TPA: hypothetical protein VKV74_13460 [Bryobacteraceae bacterium]|nr:hypothetical protein [Bryobacteraceae bacterium]
MKTQIAMLAVWASVLTAQMTTTQTLDLPPEGALRFPRSIGEMTIEGWDLPRVEIIVVKSVKPGYDEKDAAKWLQRVSVHAERRGNDIAVDTVYPKRFLLARPFRDGGLSPIELEYRVKAPRNARLAIEHQSGEVHLEFLTGDIRVTNGRGQISLYLLNGPYAIDARSKLGEVDSDFPGPERRRLGLGHSYLEQASGAASKIYLRIGFGDITILKRQQPEEPAPAKK